MSRWVQEATMDIFSAKALADYWSAPELAVNGVIFLNLLGALLLGLSVGYERSYHGRAAGMRTYGLVCMASTALTVITGYPGLWFGAHATTPPTVDPTRVIQGIVTGIGFLGAGVIFKEGFSISGLTTAASIWAASAIGVTVGVGFYAAAISLAVLAALCMTLVYKLEERLPSRSGVAIVVRFNKDIFPDEEALRKVSLEHGYEISRGTLSITFRDGQPEWQFLAVAWDKRKGSSVSDLAKMMSLYKGVESFHVSPARH
jgi:putative Mg2+ transporter-C (MgtC) family protein